MKIKSFSSITGAFLLMLSATAMAYPALKVTNQTKDTMSLIVEHVCITTIKGNNSVTLSGDMLQTICKTREPESPCLMSIYRVENCEEIHDPNLFIAAFGYNLESGATKRRMISVPYITSIFSVGEVTIKLYN